MKVIIAGSREGFTLSDVEVATQASGYTFSEVVSGTARGVDRFGEEWAKANGIAVSRFPADWDKNGKAAGHIRNRQMGDYAEALVALWDGSSKGTKGMIDYMIKLGKKVYIYEKNKP